MQRVCVQVKSKEQPVSYKLVLAIPGGSDGKDSACSAVQSLSQEDLLEEGMATHSSVLAWRVPGMGAWWAAIYGAAQSWTRLK